MDRDLKSVQQARDLLRRAHDAEKQYQSFNQEQVDRICAAMVTAGAADSARLGQLAHEETGFGRPDSKRMKNLFATEKLQQRISGMKTVGIIRKTDGDTIWEIATPMGVVAALIPSTNPTSTAMYKAIIAAKARCGIVMSPHPRAIQCTHEALRVVAEAAYAAGAPEGLFGCMTEISIAGTNELLEHDLTGVILATGGTAMVKAAYSKGKPAYGVGSGNVPAYVDRSANLAKAAADIIYGAAFDWGTLCSTERSVVADQPIKTKLIEEMKKRGAHFTDGRETELLRNIILFKGRLNVDIVGQSPARIAQMAGFTVPEDTRVLVSEVTEVGKQEPISIETLSPILSFYTEDGWQAGCARCIEVLQFGGIGHTLAIHCKNERVIEEFGLQKPSMRIVVNTLAALGSVGYTNNLFPAMTLGPGTIGGSITSDNIGPMHLLNIKRMAFETAPINDEHGNLIEGASSARSPARPPAVQSSPAHTSAGWMDEIDRRLIARAGNPPPARNPESGNGAKTDVRSSTLPLPDQQIESLIKKYRKG